MNLNTLEKLIDFVSLGEIPTFRNSERSNQLNATVFNDAQVLENCVKACLKYACIFYFSSNITVAFLGIRRLIVYEYGVCSTETFGKWHDFAYLHSGRIKTCGQYMKDLLHKSMKGFQKRLRLSCEDVSLIYTTGALVRVWNAERRNMPIPGFGEGVDYIHQNLPGTILGVTKE